MEFQARPPGGQLQRWRERGSLQYLAHQLGVRALQIARYWDDGWIPRCYRTPKGHRRIRYEADTIERVQARRAAAKATNLAIRYDLDAVTWRGRRISLEGCHSMHDLYRRARRAGLSEPDARALAYRPRARPRPPAADLYSEVLQRLKNTAREELNEITGLYASLPLDSLLEPSSPGEFRDRASNAWQEIAAELRAEDRWDRAHGSPPEWAARRDKKRRVLHDLLQHPDRDSFAAAWLKATELGTRIFDDDDAYFRKAREHVDKDPEAMRLQVAVLALKQSQERLSAAALAQVLGISRRALYRTFGAPAIRAALGRRGGGGGGI